MPVDELPGTDFELRLLPDRLSPTADSLAGLRGGEVGDEKVLDDVGGVGPVPQTSIVLEFDDAGLNEPAVDGVSASTFAVGLKRASGTSGVVVWCLGPPLSPIREALGRF